MKWVCFPKFFGPLANWTWLRISPQSSLNVIYCLILLPDNDWWALPVFLCKLNPIEAHWGKGSWPFSFERWATFPPQEEDHVFVHLIHLPGGWWVGWGLCGWSTSTIFQLKIVYSKRTSLVPIIVLYPEAYLGYSNLLNIWSHFLHTRILSFHISNCTMQKKNKIKIYYSCTILTISNLIISNWFFLHLHSLICMISFKGSSASNYFISNYFIENIFFSSSFILDSKNHPAIG